MIHLQGFRVNASTDGGRMMSGFNVGRMLVENEPPAARSVSIFPPLVAAFIQGLTLVPNSAQLELFCPSHNPT
jgi:hypothetical protein